MSAKWAIVGLGVVAVGVGAAYAVYRSKVPSFEAALPNAELAPESLVVWTEANDLRSLWSATRVTQSWKDFEASSAAEFLGKLTLVQDITAALKDVSAKAKYDLMS